MKVLVLGAAGMIGHRMWATLAKQHEVYGAVRRKELGALSLIPGINLKNTFFEIEAKSISNIENILKKIRPDIVLNCIGIVKQLKDSSDHEKSISINALFPHQLAILCQKYESRMIQFSSDCVFDGAQGNYIESNITDAKDLYGRTKALGEIGYMDNVITIRTSTIGREVFPHGGLVEWFLAQRGKKISGFSKAIYTGFPTQALAQLISEKFFPDKNLNGIIHVSSESIDKFRLLNLIKEKLKIDIQIENNQEIIIDRSLNSEMFSMKSNFKSKSWEEMIDDLLVDFDIYENIRKKYV